MRRFVVPLVIALSVGTGASAAAQDDGDDGPAPLVPVPSGCVAAELPDVVFVGTLIDRDYRTGRFEILQVRAGDPGPFAVDGVIDVRYGLDAQYLDEGEDYLVGAARDPVLGVLASKVTEAVPDFGGDDVIGVTESDVQCPVVEDAVRTFRPDGTTVDSGVLTPMFEQPARLFGAVLVPLGVAFGVVFALAMLRLALSGVAAGVSSVTHRRSR